jgi:N-acetylglutamate synthase-like GNAT family acetyltransferase
LSWCLSLAVCASQEDRQKALGVVNVSLMKASPSIATAAACKPGTPFAMITNMAVCPELRRRGISHHLMQAAVKSALVDLDISPPFALLLAYKYYEPAMR